MQKSKKTNNGLNISETGLVVLFSVLLLYFPIQQNYVSNAQHIGKWGQSKDKSVRYSSVNVRNLSWTKCSWNLASLNHSSLRCNKERLQWEAERRGGDLSRDGSASWAMSLQGFCLSSSVSPVLWLAGWRQPLLFLPACCENTVPLHKPARWETPLQLINAELHFVSGVWEEKPTTLSSSHLSFQAFSP